MHRMFDPDRFHALTITDGTGDGGGGGDGKGKDDEPPADIDPRVKDVILRSVNAAVSSQLSRKLGPAISESITGALTPLHEQLAKLTGGNGQGGDKGGADSKATDKMQAELDAMKKQLAAERGAREDEAKQRQEQTTQATIKDALTRAGVEPLRLRGALAVVRDQVARGEDGAVVFKVQKQGYTEDVDLGEGIGEWLKTDEGKAYLAPRDSRGSGSTRSGAGPKPGNKPTDPKLLRAAEKREALEGLGQQIKQMIIGGDATE